MNRVKKQALAWMLMSLVAAFQSCSGHHEEEVHHLSLADVVKADKGEPAHQVSSDKHVEDIKKMLADVPNADTFYIAERAHLITSFPCSSCHTESLPELQAGTVAGEKKAHWNIELKHASIEAMDCATCHHP